MGKIQSPKRIRVEDYKEEDQEMIGKLSESINSFQDDVYNLTLNNIDYQNINRQVVNVTVQINGSGLVVNPPQVKTTLRSKVVGVQVVSASNTNSPTTYPTSAPFVSWTINDKILTILNVTGLQSNSEYALTLEIM